jgi:DNA-binding Lrp family transcriptional regulator
MKARPVEINGVTYPSNKAAAEALGISPSTLVRRIRAGLVQYADRLPVRPIASGSWRPPRPIP